jgi:hypothetical protein
MSNNPHRPGSSAAQSFTAEEIAALEQILTTLRRGGDASVMARQPVVVRIARKVDAMTRSIARQRGML